MQNIVKVLANGRRLMEEAVSAQAEKDALGRVHSGIRLVRQNEAARVALGPVKGAYSHGSCVDCILYSVEEEPVWESQVIGLALSCYCQPLLRC